MTWSWTDLETDYGIRYREIKAMDDKMYLLDTGKQNSAFLKSRLKILVLNQPIKLILSNKRS